MSWAGTSLNVVRPMWDEAEHRRTMPACPICGRHHSADECPETIGQRWGPSPVEQLLPVNLFLRVLGATG